MSRERGGLRLQLRLCFPCTQAQTIAVLMPQSSCTLNMSSDDSRQEVVLHSRRRGVDDDWKFNGGYAAGFSWLVGDKAADCHFDFDCSTLAAEVKKSHLKADAIHPSTVTERFEAELGQATALDRRLAAELGASEESQASRLHSANVTEIKRGIVSRLEAS